MRQQEEIGALIIELLIGIGGAAVACYPSFERLRYERNAAINEPQEFSSRQVKLVAELLKERAGWRNLEKGMDPIHESGIRYFPCNNNYSFYTVMNDHGVWVEGATLTSYDRRELQRLYNALVKEVKNERQSELTRTLARRVVSGERVKAEPVAEQLDIEPVKSLGFNPLAGTSWEDTYTSAGVSINHSPGRLMLTAGAVSGNELHRLQLELQRKVRETPDPAKQSELYI